MKEKVALFDFDKTIINQDSFFLLYKKTIQEHKDYRPRLYGGLIRKVFSLKKKKYWKLDIKTEFLQMLHLYTEEEIKNFVHFTLLQENIYPQAKKEIYRLKDEGFKLLLVSASVENYLKYVMDVLPFDHYIGTKADENYNIISPNNKREVKVDNIKNYFQEKGWEIDYENSVAYSDSLSADGPMLEMVKNRYLINNKIVPEGYTGLNWTIEKKSL